MASREFWDAAFSSKHNDLETPKWLLDKLSTRFAWDLDVCASRAHVCNNYLIDNGLIVEWTGLCWMNPPYGNQIGCWVKKARVSKGATVVCLVPARTDTRWWQENIPYASLVIFIKGRLKFENQRYSAPFPSAFVVFGKLEPDQAILLRSFGLGMRKE